MEGFAAAVPAFDPRALSPGTRLGKYEVIQRLAVGGMAELYLARAQGISGFEKLVVIKRVHPHLASDAGFIRMFLNEARLAATLDHPNVTSVMDIGMADGEHFFTMEYLHGEDLREVLQRAAPRGGLPRECAIEVLRGVARGLHHAHERVGSDGRPLGMVHRDVSPSNVFVTYEGGVKVVDFGIAKAGALTKQTQAGTLKGKIGYMSPEACRGDPVDRRSDVFALGILLYETTTGRRLFFAESQYAVLNKIIEGRYAPPSAVVSDYPDELEAIVRRALAVDPDERYPTAEVFQLALEEFAHEARLRCSPHVLSRYLEGLLGRRPYPTADIPITERPVQTGDTEVAAETRPEVATDVATVPRLEVVSSEAAVEERRGRGWVAYALVGVVAMVVGLGVGGMLRSEPESEAAAEPVAGSPAPEPSSASALPAAAAEPLRHEAAAGDEAVAGDEAPDVDGEDDAGEDPESGEEEDEPESAPGQARKRRRRAKTRDKAKDDQRRGKSLYPPSYYER